MTAPPRIPTTAAGRALSERMTGTPSWMARAILAIEAESRASLDQCEWCIPRHEWPCPTIPRCDEPGCEDEATCGWPSRPGGTGPNGGYRRTCGPHMREYAKKPQP